MRSQTTSPDSEAILSFDVEGMTCASCASRVERILGRQPGVDAAAVNLATRTATVRIGETVDPDALAEAVHRIGYGLSLRQADDRPKSLTDAYSSEAAALWRRFWVAVGLSLDRKSTRLNSSHVKNSYAVF